MERQKLLDIYSEQLPVILSGKCAMCRYWEEFEEPNEDHVHLAECEEFGGEGYAERLVENGFIGTIVRTSGWCKRMPPSLPTLNIAEEQDDPYHACWPATSNSDWCGEYLRKVTP